MAVPLHSIAGQQHRIPARRPQIGVMMAAVRYDLSLETS